MKTTEQIEFWNGEFGKEYTDRNSMHQEEWDSFYINEWGRTKVEINESILKDIPRTASILEVGCNNGQQLVGYQRSGFSNLYGVELQTYAVEKAKEFTTNINIVKGSGFDLPFKDDFFDIVCTNGVLIHIAPEDHFAFMSEMVRCSKKFIMGFEYYSDDFQVIPYRGNSERMWKGNFPQIFMDQFDLKMVRQNQIPYMKSNNVDIIYLLEK